MKKIVVIKKVDELTPGYILKENIGNYKSLQEGSILDTDKINLIRELGIKQIAVLELVDDSEVQEEKTKAISKEITKRIEEIFNERKYETKKEENILKPEDFIPKYQPEAKDIINHIKKSDEDILEIENGEKVSIRKINESINISIKSIEKLLIETLEKKEINIKRLERIVEELITITGPKRESSFLLLGILRKGKNLIIKHSVNTCLLSLAIAIEMSKLMKSQLQKKEVLGDFKKLKICNSKIFNKEELIKLGIAALLHDIGLVDVFPDITENTIISTKDFSKIQLHPSKAYSFLSNINVDFDIRKAILQHHEFMDGSGYPDGITSRMFNKYSKVLSFANYYDLKTTKNPFENKMHPQKALRFILQKERKKFDDDVIFAFCKSASLYPIGSWVALSDDRIGLVIKSNKNNLTKPVVKVVYSSDLKELSEKKFIDIERSHLFIKNIIDVESIEIFDKRYERFIFDEREFKRISVELKTEIKIANTNIVINGVIENLSAGGSLLKSAFDISKGEHLILTFSFQNKKFKNILGIIVWKKEEKPMFLYGIRFLYLHDDEHKFLYDTINNIQNYN